MPDARAVSAFLVCAALAACEAPDATSPSTATAAPAASVAFVDDGGGTMLVNEAETFLEAAAPDTAGPFPGFRGPPALTNGHFELAAPDPVIPAEYYSYTARGTDFPAAEGEIEIHGHQRVGNLDFVAHGRVLCMSVLGNEAWVSSRLTKVMTNNQDRPDLVGITASIRVQDNGEGATRPDDFASLVYFRQNSQFWCRFRPRAPMTPTANGNIQVH